MLLLGFLASAEVNPTIGTTFKKGDQVVSLAGGLAQLGNQAIGVLVALALGMIGTFLLLKIIQVTIGLRVPPDGENAGLDLSEHGESAYND
jgi:Amt family ammonium transporter